VRLTLIQQGLSLKSLGSLSEYSGFGRPKQAFVKMGKIALIADFYSLHKDDAKDPPDLVVGCAEGPYMLQTGKTPASEHFLGVSTYGHLREKAESRRENCPKKSRPLLNFPHFNTDTVTAVLRISV
jgi:hypothetical protein